MEFILGSHHGAESWTGSQFGWQGNQSAWGIIPKFSYYIPMDFFASCQKEKK